jgi:poly-gamma-glutamate synthesis protein (capsule biosynthesis protein)
MARRKKLKMEFKVIFAILILLLAYFGYRYFFKKSDDKSNPVIELITKPKETWPKTYKVSLIAAGDTVLHNDVVNYAKKSDGSLDFSPYLTEITDLVKSYDIAYYNQETVFGGKEMGYSFYPRFNSPSEFGDAMIKAGFNTVSLANNHSNDRGEQAILNSLEYWKKQDNIMYSGMASSEEERTNYIIMEKNNIKYAMISYTYGTNGLKLPAGKDYLVNIYSDELAKKDIEYLRDKVDVLLVAMHWGVEYTHNPTTTQKEQAKYLASLGVDVVIGNHPHCIQPVEWIDNTLIIYSLGNLLSNQMIMINQYGYKVAIGAFAMMDFVKTVNEDGTSKVTIENVELELHYNYKNTQQKTYKIVPFSKMNTTYLSNYKKVYDEFKAVLQKMDPDIKVKPSA